MKCESELAYDFWAKAECEAHLKFDGTDAERTQQAIEFRETKIAKQNTL